MQALFTVRCDEPEGSVDRTVYLLELTPANIQKFWDKAKQFHTIYGRELKSVDDFLNLFLYYDKDGTPQLNGLFFVIDDFVGVFYLSDITPLWANVHYTFFDRRHKGRVPLVRRMLEYVFTEYKFHKLIAEVPNYASKFTRKFIVDVGFWKCGIRRNEAPYKGDFFDVTIYDILAKEVIRNGKAKN